MKSTKRSHQDFSRRYLRAFWLYSFAVLCLLFSSCSSKPPNENREMRIGITAPLTGTAAVYGQDLKNGIALAFEQAPIVDDIRLSPIYEDDQGDPKLGVSAAQKLISVDHVQAIMPMFSSVVLAVAPLAESSHVLLLTPGGSAPSISQAGEFVFRNNPSDDFEGRIMARVAVERIHTARAAVLYIENAWGTAIRGVLTSEFRHLGGDVAIEESFAEGAVDFRTTLLKIREAKPDVVFFAAHIKELATLLRQLREVGLQTNFVSTSGAYTPDLFSLAGTAAEGLVVVTTSGFEASSQDPQVKRFVETYREKYGKEAGYPAALGYDAVNIIVWAVQQGARDGVGLKNALNRMKDFPGITGKTSFDKNGDAIKPSKILQVRNGRFEAFEE